MHVDKKVGWALEAIGVVLLLATATFNLKIFWAVFGFSCTIAGAYKVIKRLLLSEIQALFKMKIFGFQVMT